MDSAPVRLTQTVKKGGCAAKLPAGELRKVLSGLRPTVRPELLLGSETLDDACLWDLGNQCMVQTLDFFTPIVDDARDFGAIAAANAISDVYAMGGTPALALTILAFPTAHLPMSLLGELMEGACEKIAEAGAALGGGHTIDDETLKLGFSVTGFVDKKHAWKNSGAQTGDVLILTKGLGTGTLTTALKANEGNPESIAQAIASMKLLNRVLDLIDGTKVHAATDITGFGLAGHSLQMAQASEKLLVFHTPSLPEIPGALKSIEDECLNRAHFTNRDYTEAHVKYEGATDAQRWLTLDPQTSGGLLLCVPRAEATAMVDQLRKRFPLAAIVGEVREQVQECRVKFES